MTIMAAKRRHDAYTRPLPAIKMRQQILYILTISILLSSCASLLNSKQTRLKIISNEPVGIIINKDTINHLLAEKEISVSRSKEPLKLTIFNDSIKKTVSVESKNSFAYWLNLYPNLHLWTGFLIDKNKAKRYAYSKRIYIDVYDTIPRYFTYYPWSRKGNIDLHFSLPHINSFLLNPENENNKKVNTGFWGLTLGLDYYHSRNQFINLSASGVSDFFVPFPAAVDISGEYELMSSSYISLSNNHRYKRFLFGYGISYSKNTWDFRYYDRFDPPPPTREPVKKSHIALGLIFPAYFQMGEHFNIGLVYRPSFYRPNMTDKFKYEHLESIDFAWKIPLMK